MDSIILIMFLAIVIIGVLLLVFIAFTRKSAPPLNQERYRAKWLAIENSISSEESSLQFAVLNADKLLDEALKARRFQGKTMGERMKNAKDVFKNNNAVWAAHKLRNKIAHESDVQIKPQTAQHALAAFKAALKDLRAL